MQESNLKQFETSFHLRHRQLVFKRPGFLGSGSERGMEYGFNCFADRAAQRPDKAFGGDGFSREGWVAGNKNAHV